MRSARGGYADGALSVGARLSERKRLAVLRLHQNRNSFRGPVVGYIGGAETCFICSTTLEF